MRRLALRRARWPGLVPRASLLRFLATRAPPAAAAPTTVAKRSEGGGAAPAVATHADALAGVSAEYLVEHEERVGHGQRLPVMWNNPGAFGQLHRLSDDMILAMPPPRRPFHPMSESYLTWKYIRSFSIVILFVALALYLQAKSRVKGVARIEAEQRFPGLVRLLVHLGVLEDFAARAVCLGGLCGTEGLVEAHAFFAFPPCRLRRISGFLPSGSLPATATEMGPPSPSLVRPPCLRDSCSLTVRRTDARSLSRFKRSRDKARDPRHARGYQRQPELGAPLPLLHPGLQRP